MRGGALQKVIDTPAIDGKYKTFDVKPEMPGFGATIENLDLTADMSDATRAELRQALLDFEVLFFPPQELEAAHHVQLATCFGPLAKGSFFERKEESPEVEMIVFDKDTPPEINIWHSDLSWQKTPPLGSAIQITELPDAGGNTAFLSMTRAYDALSDGMKIYLQDLKAIHTFEVSGFYEKLESKGIDALVNAIKTFRPVEHPVVTTHPESGRKALYVNETFTKEIVVDGHFREARGMLDFLLKWMQQPEFMIHHKWQKNGLAVWDNRATQHYACADYWPNRRVTQRVTVEQPDYVDTANPAQVTGFA